MLWLSTTRLCPSRTPAPSWAIWKRCSSKDNRREDDYLGTSIVAGLATACGRDPELARALNDRFLETGHRVLRLVLERAVDRGEVPRGRDLEFIIEIIPALFFSRVLTSGKPPDKAFAHRIVHEVIYPLATSPLP